MIDRAGLPGVLGHAEGLLDMPELVVDIDHEVGILTDQFGGVFLAPGQRPGLGLHKPSQRLGHL